jgi:hypothetical protein
MTPSSINLNGPLFLVRIPDRQHPTTLCFVSGDPRPACGDHPVEVDVVWEGPWPLPGMTFTGFIVRDGRRCYRLFSDDEECGAAGYVHIPGVALHFPDWAHVCRHSAT